MEVITSHQTITPIIEKWPLMGTPAPIVLIFLSYLFFVLKFGPKFMESRKPFSLTNFTRIYNIYQVLACSAFVHHAYTTYNFKLSDTWSCIPFETNVDLWLTYKNAYWWFLCLRLSEFAETVVFVLRKKQNQVSVLHVYHHISTAFVVWVMLKHNPCK
jgi:hypothetical protein